MLKIEVSNIGAELISINFKGKEMLHDGKSFWDRQAPILFPMVGRLRNNKTIINGKKYIIPQHGFAKDMQFQLIEKTKDKRVYKTNSNIKTLKMYPFKFELYTIYEIEQNKLTVKYKVINTDNKDILFGMGGHPGFKLDMPQEEYYFELEKEENKVEFLEVEGDYISNLPSKSILENNKIINITENSFINDAIMMKNLQSKTITLKQKKDNIKVLEFDFSDFPILAIWTIPKAPFICLEPWFNTADKVVETGHFKDKEGIMCLKPNQKFSCKFSIKFFE